MTDNVSPEEHPARRPSPDLMGIHIPPNERFTRFDDGEAWQPGFEPLGQPDHGDRHPGTGAPQTAPPEDEVTGAARQGQAPLRGHVSGRARPHRRSGRACWGTPRKQSPGWFWFLFAIVFWVIWSDGGGGWWWMLFLIWPAMALLKRASGGGSRTLGLLLIVAGAAMLLLMAGAPTTIFAPLLLVGLGLWLLLRATGLLAEA
jgi:hypothetical protein